MRIHVHITRGESASSQQSLEILRQLRSELTALALNQEHIMAQNDEILQEVSDLRAAVGVIGEGVGTLTANLAVANDRIAELQGAGVAPETVALLKSAVDGAQAVADRFAKAADPEVETPSDPTPEPVENVPAPAGDLETVPEPATDAPAAPVAEEGVVAEDPTSVESDENTAS